MPPSVFSPPSLLESPPPSAPPPAAGADMVASGIVKYHQQQALTLTRGYASQAPREPASQRSHPHRLHPHQPHPPCQQEDELQPREEHQQEEHLDLQQQHPQQKQQQEQQRQEQHLQQQEHRRQQPPGRRMAAIQAPDQARSYDVVTSNDYDNRQPPIAAPPSPLQPCAASPYFRHAALAGAPLAVPMGPLAAGLCRNRGSSCAQAAADHSRGGGGCTTGVLAAQAPRILPGATAASLEFSPLQANLMANPRARMPEPMPPASVAAMGTARSRANHPLAQSCQRLNQQPFVPGGWRQLATGYGRNVSASFSCGPWWSDGGATTAASLAAAEAPMSAALAARRRTAEVLVVPFARGGGGGGRGVSGEGAVVAGPGRSRLGRPHTVGSQGGNLVPCPVEADEYVAAGAGGAAGRQDQRQQPPGLTPRQWVLAPQQRMQQMQVQQQVQVQQPSALTPRQQVLVQQVQQQPVERTPREQLLVVQQQVPRTSGTPEEQPPQHHLPGRHSASERHRRQQQQHGEVGEQPGQELPQQLLQLQDPDSLQQLQERHPQARQPQHPTAPQDKQLSARKMPSWMRQQVQLRLALEIGQSPAGSDASTGAPTETDAEVGEGAVIVVLQAQVEVAVEAEALADNAHRPETAASPPPHQQEQQHCHHHLLMYGLNAQQRSRDGTAVPPVPEITPDEGGAAAPPDSESKLAAAPYSLMPYAESQPQELPDPWVSGGPERTAESMSPVVVASGLALRQQLCMAGAGGSGGGGTSAGGGGRAAPEDGDSYWSAGGNTSQEQEHYPPHHHRYRHQSSGPVEWQPTTTATSDVAGTSFAGTGAHLPPLPSAAAVSPPYPRLPRIVTPAKLEAGAEAEPEPEAEPGAEAQFHVAAEPEAGVAVVGGQQECAAGEGSEQQGPQPDDACGSLGSYGGVGGSGSKGAERMDDRDVEAVVSTVVGMEAGVEARGWAEAEPATEVADGVDGS